MGYHLRCVVRADMPKLENLCPKLVKLHALGTQCMCKGTKCNLTGSGGGSGKLERALALLTNTAATRLQPPAVVLECRPLLADPGCPY